MFGMRDLIPWSRGRDITTNRRGPEHPLTTFQRDLDRMFEDLWQSFDLPAFGRFERERSMITPRLDFHETDTEIVVTAELPGMEEKDVEVVLGDNVLTIKGEKKAEHEEKEKGYAYSERSYGFVRTAYSDRHRDRVRQGRCRVQERRADGHPAEEARGPEALKACSGSRLRRGKEDGEKGRLNDNGAVFGADRFSGPPLFFAPIPFVVFTSAAVRRARGYGCVFTTKSVQNG